MKMSDVFNLPVKFECADLFTMGSGFMIDTDETTNKQAEFASVAVNNHDKLTEELQAKTDFLNLKLAECDKLTERVKELEGGVNAICSILDIKHYTNYEKTHRIEKLLMVHFGIELEKE